MSRKPRKLTETGCYHVVVTGINHMDIFLEEADKSYFRKKLFEYSKELNIKIHSFVIMDNHVHVEIGNATETMSLLIQKLCTSYAMYYNKKYDRHGPLFNGRFKSEPIEDINYFLAVCRYINQNPEKAGISKTEHYKWSSYNYYKRKKSIIDSGIFIDYFSNRELFLQFLKKENNDLFLEYQNVDLPINSKDNLYSIFIQQLLNISSPIEIAKFSFDRIVFSLNLLKKCGISVTQISRLTGLSYGKIEKYTQKII